MSSIASTSVSTKSVEMEWECNNTDGLFYDDREPDRIKRRRLEGCDGVKQESEAVPIEVVVGDVEDDDDWVQAKRKVDWTKDLHMLKAMGFGDEFALLSLKTWSPSDDGDVRMIGCRCKKHKWFVMPFEDGFVGLG